MEEEPGRERWPPGAATQGSASRVPQALLLLLLLLLLLPTGQGSTPDRCDCASDSQKRYGTFCCRGCPKGHYMKASCTEPCGDSTCLPCPQGTFLTRGNHFKTDCTRCQACDEEGDPEELFSSVGHPVWLPIRLASCLLHRAMQGKFTFFLPLMLRLYNSTNPRILGPRASGGLLPAWGHPDLRVLPMPALQACGSCRHSWDGDPDLTPDSAHTLLAPQGSSGKVCTTVQLVGNSWIPGLSQTQEMACSQAPQPWNQLPNRTLGLPLAPLLPPAPPAGSPAAMLQPGPQLYDVMDAVPARRWKEFVRTLGLREAEIEAVEVEICRFRDQQYEMLKRWRQQQPAGLGAIYAALERMGLEGCAEDLRSRLQHCGP
ncbi:hypothetical protein A6R68_20678 [Neotoma lepida]|uniref:Death domain-containing protein n=1 Tax=Neotoma lepida TaxID=56216 RepID=A0A1A6HSX3_NEOLE|nr:hypothetical protein A6R68_20678 [Neotoma lepida]